MLKIKKGNLYIDQLIEKIHSYSKQELKECVLNFVAISKSIEDKTNIVLILDETKVYFSINREGKDLENLHYFDIPNKNPMTKLFLTSKNLHPKYLIDTNGLLFKHIDYFISNVTNERVLSEFRDNLFEEMNTVKLKYYQDFNLDNLNQVLYDDLTEKQKYIQFTSVICKSNVFYNYINTDNINNSDYRDSILEDVQISNYINKFRNISPNEFFEFIEDSINVTDSMEEMYYMFQKSEILTSPLLN